MAEKKKNVEATVHSQLVLPVRLKSEHRVYTGVRTRIRTIQFSGLGDVL